MVLLLLPALASTSHRRLRLSLNAAGVRRLHFEEATALKIRFQDARLVIAAAIFHCLLFFASMRQRRLAWRHAPEILRALHVLHLYRYPTNIASPLTMFRPFSFLRGSWKLPTSDGLMCLAEPWIKQWLSFSLLANERRDESRLVDGVFALRLEFVSHLQHRAGCTT